MTHAESHTEHQHQGSLAGYVVGFMLSIAFTLGAYLLVTHHLLAGNALVAAIVTLAIAQLVVQLFLFLHFGSGAGAGWNAAAFAFMGLIVFILVGGSLWIMANLNYNMDSTGVSTYLSNQDGL